MRWIAQVGHVAEKDLRYARWPLTTYVAMVSLAAAGVVTGRALGPYSASPTTQVLGMMDMFVAYLPMGIVILALIVTASLVQADSPTRTTAFWASRPLWPSAVLSSKMVLVLVAIIALPMVAGAAALRSFDADGPTITGMLARAGLSYGEWLVAALIVGALTDDTRAFVTAFLAILAGTVVLGLSLDLDAHAGPLTPLTLTLVGLVGGVVLLGFLYRTREKRLRTWIGGIAAVACLVVASAAPLPVRPIAAHTFPTGPRLEIAPVNPHTWATQQVQLQMRMAELVDSARLTFQPDTVRVETRDGTILFGHGPWPAFEIGGRAAPPVGRSVRWIGGRPSTQWTGFSHELDRQVLLRGVKSILVAGTVTVSRPRLVASIPLRTGASVTHDGRRVAIYGVSYGPTGADAWVRVSAVAGAGALQDPTAQSRSMNGLQFAIVNEARSEAMLTEQRTGSGSSGSIVLPWIDVWTTFTRFATNETATQIDSGRPDNAWYAQARLVIVAWTVTGNYRTSAEAVLP